MYADTAAAIHTLDLVVTVDTSVAHLAGALGKPGGLLLPFVAEGRWMEGLRTAQQMVLQGRYDEADRWAKRLDGLGSDSTLKPLPSCSTG